MNGIKSPRSPGRTKNGCALPSERTATNTSAPNDIGPRAAGRLPSGPSTTMVKGDRTIVFVEGLLLSS